MYARPCSSRSTTMAVKTTRLVTAMQTISVSRERGVVNTGGVVRKVLSSSKALSASDVQKNFSDARRSLKKGRAFSPRREIKRLRATKQPASFWTSFTLVGRFILVTADTLSGFGSMARRLTRFPNRMPDETPKIHFVGLSFQRYLRRFANVSLRSVMRVSAVLDLTTTSST